MSLLQQTEQLSVAHQVQGTFASPGPKVNLRGLKVCFLAGTLGQGGAERQLFYNLRTLQQNGAQPVVLCLGKNEFWESRITRLGIPVAWVGQSPSKLRRLLGIIRALQKLQPQIVQSQHFYTNSYAAVSARVIGVPGIGAMRNDGISEVRCSGVLGGRLNLHLPRLLAANSQVAIRYALSHGVRLDRLFLLRNVVDTEQIRPQKRPQTGTVRLMAIGRLYPEKRFDRFVSVLAKLREQLGPVVAGSIVGSGPLRAQLADQARVLGLLPSVLQFTGSVPEIAPVLQAAHIFALTSDYEGCPNVLLEAMAAGLPVVATRVGGVPEVLGDKANGIMVQAGDDGALYSALAHLISNQQAGIEMGLRARAYIEANHSPKVLAGLLSNLYGMAFSRLSRSGRALADSVRGEAAGLPV